MMTTDEISVLTKKVEQAAKDLEEKGYAIIPSLYSRDECLEIRKKMWAHLAEISNGELTPEKDYSKMRATELPSHKHGIVESWRFNHMAVIREIRRDPRILWVYALLYGTDQLTGSMDRVNFKFPGRQYKSRDSWPHVDQHAAKENRISIQSYVTFLDCDADSPGNRFYEGSHKIFAEFFKAKRDDKTGDWNKLTDEEKITLPKQCPLIKPTYPEGSLLLWDSRVVHDPDDGTNFDVGRFVVYVCYNKAWEKSEDEKFWTQKKNAFIDCRATSHAPIPQTMFAKCPRLYDRAEKGRYDEIPKEKLGIAKPDEPIGAEAFLFGFKRYQKEGLLLAHPQWQEKRKPLLEFVSPFAAKKRNAASSLTNESVLKKCKLSKTG
jgi:hypothetical protein